MQESLNDLIRKENNMKNIGFVIVVTTMFAIACDNGPKVISANEEAEQTSGGTGIFNDQGLESKPEAELKEAGLHRVKVLEALPTDKYIYLYVEEEGEEFWIATLRQEVVVGGRYFYKDGLLKTNFESKEYNRVFDRLYLVAQIVPIDHNTQSEAIEIQNKKTDPASEQQSIVRKEGSITIAELVDNPTKYQGKRVQISGRCVKVNNAIMGRNWMHFVDGTRDSYDLVITSDIALPEGHAVTITAVVALNKDFGAGYSYEIILEDGQLVE